MAFTPGSIANTVGKQTGSSNGFVPGSIAETVGTTQTTGGFKAGSVAGTSGLSSRSLKNSEGLYNLAVQSGLQKEAEAIRRQQAGESQNKIYSGGFITDIFDTLNALQYGVTGLIKGKTFSEGVRTRQSFSDKDSLGDKGIPGFVAGILLDIAVDPLTYISPWTIAKKVPLISKLAKATKAGIFGKPVLKAVDKLDKFGKPLGEAAQKAAKAGITRNVEVLEGGTKAGKYLGRKFVWFFGQDPAYRRAFERSVKNTGVSTQKIVKLSQSVSKLEPKDAAKILSRDDVGRFFRTPLNKVIKEIPEESREAVAKLYKTIDDLSKEAIDLGVIGKSAEDNIGSYIKNVYEEYEKGKKLSGFGRAISRIKGSKARKAVKDVSELGVTQIDNPAYILFKTATDLARDVETAKLFRTVNKAVGSDVALDGFTKLADTKGLGELAGKFIPQDMAMYINALVEPTTKSVGKDLVAGFKFAKVIMNPATHARNLISNRTLNWWKLGIGPWDVKLDAKVVKALREGDSNKYIKMATKEGWGMDTFSVAEMPGLLNSPEALGFGSKAKGKWGQVKKALGDLYQNEENYSKLSAFIHQVDKGFSPEEAWKAAESATFNYAQVTPFIRKVRESAFGMPFITFTVKSTPVAIETALKHPGRISAIGKIKRAIEQRADIDKTERERAAEPPWVRDGFYIKLPGEDKYGRSKYFDLTYILPFGDLVSGNFFERGTDRETGTREGIPSAVFSKSPFFQVVKELSKNQDFYGNKIWKDADSSDKQSADIMRHLSKTYLPPLIADQIPGGYNRQGERQQRGIAGALESQENIGQKRTLMQEMLRNVGAKIQPMDADMQEMYKEWNLKKAYETLLLENNQETRVKEYNSIYQAKQ